jgi:hypothetical protein
MDNSKTAKTYFSDKVLECLNELDMDKEVLMDSLSSVNICFSNDTHIFVYVEKLASIVAININKLGKSTFDADKNKTFQVSIISKFFFFY